MSTPAPAADPVVSARLAENAARQRLSAAVAELRYRLDPDRVARNTVEQVRTISTEAAQTAAAQVRANPRAAAGGATGLALFMLRRPIARVLTWPFRRRKKVRLPPPPSEAELRRFSEQIGQPAPVGLLSQEG